jgi:hypothetical protein
MEIEFVSKGQFVEHKLELSWSFRCDQIPNNYWRESFVVLLESDPVIPLPTLIKVLKCVCSFHDQTMTQHNFVAPVDASKHRPGNTKGDLSLYH